MKGLYVNFSGSGTSLSLGVKGASLTFGKKGTYLNTGIPGTGLYSRAKISGSNSVRQPSSLKTNNETYYKVRLILDEKGKPNLQVFDAYENEITDEKIIARLKRQDAYKRALEQAQNEMIENVESEIKNLVEIYKLTPPLILKARIEMALKNLTPQKYKVLPYTEPQPDKEKIKEMLVEKAKVEIKKVLFWKNKVLRENYVNENIDIIYTQELKRWENNKHAFLERQANKEIEENKKYEDEYKLQKNIYENYLNLILNESYINNEIEQILSSITLPVDFSIDYEFDKSKSCLYIDLDLPEIESIPVQKINRLSSGKISVKDKTKKEIANEYATCVVGIAYLFAGTFFNIAVNIEKILISGYTQRTNPKTGTIQDDYVYSVLFEREIFKSLNINNIDPIQALSNFENKIAINANFELKTIVPFVKI
jgi:hypothetical protein